MTTIAVLGLGSMGSRIARRLLHAGHPVVVYNRTIERARELEADGAQVAESPRQAADRANVMLSIVRDNEASREIWLDKEHGAIHSLEAGKIAVESSTLTPAWMCTLGRTIIETGAGFLDAPVVGTLPHAESGNLISLLGGDGAHFESVRNTLLEPIASTVRHVGDVGDATTFKLAINTLLSVQAATVAELLGMLRASGLQDLKKAVLLNAMPTASPAAQRMSELMAESKDFAPNFPIELVAKDLSYVIEHAEQFSADVPIARAAHTAFRRAVEEGNAKIDISGIMQQYRST